MPRDVLPDHALLERDIAEDLAVQLLSLLRSMGGDGPVLRTLRANGAAEDLLTSDIRMLPPGELRKLNGRALASLASIANRQDGRPPIRPEDWDMLVLCLVSSRTLREAINRASEFYRMLDERWGRIELHTHGDIAEIRIDARRKKHNMVSFVVDTVGIAALHGLFGWLIRQVLPVSSIHLEYAQEMRPGFCSGLLPFPLTFGAQATALLFPSHYLDHAATRTSEDCGDQLILSFANHPREERVQTGLVPRARLVMYRALRDSNTLLSLEELSSRLGRHRATVRRKLSQEGASYNQLKVACRRELGLDLLRRSQLSVEAIAARLGFCDSDAFRRSFRDWIGVSPSQYRKTERTPGDPSRTWLGIGETRLARPTASVLALAD